MMKITEAKALEGYKLELKFADGIHGVVDVSYLVGQGVFALWNDFEAFRKVRIGTSGELIWNDQVDLCPDSLYMKITGKRPEDVFPNLKREMAHA